MCGCSPESDLEEVFGLDGEQTVEEFTETILTAAPLVVAGVAHKVPGLGVTYNHLTNKRAAFGPAHRATPRVADPTEILLHESVTSSRAATLRVLKRRDLSVHLIVDADGSVTQHGDLSTVRMAHAGGHNGPSIGLEIVNPYYGGSGAGAKVWPDKLRAGWVHRKVYRIPTDAQLVAAYRLCLWLTSDVLGLDIPRVFPGVQQGKMWMTTAPGGQKRQPGIWAHAQTSNHADAPFVALYLYMRFAGLDHREARAESIERATGASRWVPVADLGGVA